MTLKEFGIKLKQELQSNGSHENIECIAKKINDASIDGKALSNEQKNELLGYIANDYTKDGKVILKESDNSQWLKTMSVLKAILNNSKS